MKDPAEELRVFIETEVIKQLLSDKFDEQDRKRRVIAESRSRVRDAKVVRAMLDDISGSIDCMAKEAINGYIDNLEKAQ